MFLQSTPRRTPTTGKPSAKTILKVGPLRFLHSSARYPPHPFHGSTSRPDADELRRGTCRWSGKRQSGCDRNSARDQLTKGKLPKFAHNPIGVVSWQKRKRT